MPFEYVGEQFFLVAKVMRDDSGAKTAAPTDTSHSGFTNSLRSDEFHDDIGNFFTALIMIDYLWHDYYITSVVL
jgi:hypothetical protein